MSGAQKILYWSFYMKTTYETGLLGEEAAEKYLQETYGMVCLERRYRTKHGEIDLIMQCGEMIVFVEVKTRKTGSPGMGMMAIDSAKQKRISTAAMLYLMKTHRLNQAVRFDVVEINPVNLLHIPNAFQPGNRFYR